MQVDLQLEINGQWEYITLGDDAKASGPSRSFTIVSNTAQSVSFPVHMTTLGEVSFKIVAKWQLGGDSLVRKVWVKVR